MDLPLQVAALPGPGRYVVAFSGGLDSTVLLHWLCAQGHRLRAVHVNHHLHPDSQAWADHCAAVCAALGCEFRSMDVEVSGIEDLGLEAAARQARYQALWSGVGPNEILLTAHHADDQAETLLLQLLRGAGPAGLAGMPAGKTHGRHLRPLLGQTHDALLAYARAHALGWVEDPSNANEALNRNYLRGRVIPVLKARWPEMAVTLSRAAGLQAQAAELLADLAEADLREAGGQVPGTLSVSALLALTEARRRNLLRHVISSRGLALPNAVHLNQIDRELLGSREDANPCIRWAQIEVRRYRDDLYLMPALPKMSQVATLRWKLEEPLLLPEGCGELVAKRASGAGLSLQKPVLDVCFQPASAAIQLEKSIHHKKLKHLFQEAGVPPWVRKRLPVIYYGGDLSAVADRWIAAGYAAQGEQEGWQILWRNAPAGWLATQAETEQ